ncbi:hypothetical protein MDA_GLEAN10000118 [Myotis davidii]|uniref:Uncharacterized protein n=1 Tax=Myotis davidii TaxID=225400 RepID=L5MLH2_MYODS|nr:hypothetical protein MDA_GLEAN10000118 [Myotis davidii]
MCPTSPIVPPCLLPWSSDPILLCVPQAVTVPRALMCLSQLLMVRPCHGEGWAEGGLGGGKSEGHCEHEVDSENVTSYSH